jgi:hypothetical protein
MSRYLVVAALALLLVSIIGCGTSSSRPSAMGAAPDERSLFEDVTASSGVDLTYHNGEEADRFALLESLGGGVGLIDYNGDGLLDIFLPGGGTFEGSDRKQIHGRLGKLYKNLGNWKFKDVTAEVGLDRLEAAQPFYYTHGCAVADYDCDGWPDLLITGYGRLALFHNEDDGRGGRRFRDVTRECGLLGDHFWSTSAAWGDLDGDGYPDLYVCQYVDWSWANDPLCRGYTTDVARDVCAPRQFNAVPHALYRNVAGAAGCRQFVDVSQAAGIRAAPREDGDYGKGLGVLLVDLKGDGRPDIYVANDTSGNLLFLNESSPGRLKFRDSGFQVGVARNGTGIPTGSMGVDAADYNGTGLASLFVTNYEGEYHSLYRNKPTGGQVFFHYSTPMAGIAAIGQNFVGFGTAFLDVDGDGWEDLVITNGHVIRYPSRCGLRQRPVLFRNRGDSRFDDLTARGGAYFLSEHRGRGLAVGDLDNDGRPDLVISHVNEPVVLLRNQAAEDNHWLGIELARPGHVDVVGARLILEVGGRNLTRFAKGGGSYLSSGDRRHLFGLGTARTVGRLTVQWPAGEPRTQQWEGLGVDRYYRLTQGDPIGKELPRTGGASVAR